MSASIQPKLPSPPGEPTWEVVELFPRQGQWSEADFHRLHTNRLAELVDGRLEILPMPTWLHQLMVRYFCQQLEFQLESRRGGKALFAPLPVRLFPGTIREPDVLYVLPEHMPVDPRGFPEQLDLVVEIVSEGPEAYRRDYVSKRADYAKAGVSEYWIVDPQAETITVLTLVDGAYQEIVYRAGEIARSQFFTDFSIDVSAVFALGN